MFSRGVCRRALVAALLAIGAISQAGAQPAAVKVVRAVRPESVLWKSCGRPVKSLWNRRR
jgi:hypothetical protein